VRLAAVYLIYFWGTIMLPFVAIDLPPAFTIIAISQNWHLAASDPLADKSKVFVPKKKGRGKEPSAGTGAGDPSHTKDIWPPMSDINGGGTGTGVGGGHTKDHVVPPEK
jgi:hypothetical protein